MANHRLSVFEHMGDGNISKVHLSSGTLVTLPPLQGLEILYPKSSPSPAVQTPAEGSTTGAAAGGAGVGGTKEEPLGGAQGADSAVKQSVEPNGNASAYTAEVAAGETTA
jgi:hypothetical protein